MVAQSFYRKCFLLAELKGGRDGPEFTSVNTLLCDVQNRKLDSLYAVFMGLCSQILHVPAEFSSECINRQELPLFLFSSPKKKKNKEGES